MKTQKTPASTLQLFHGSSSTRSEEVASSGLQAPYLTSSVGLAAYYAETAAIEDGGTPVIYEVEAEVANLRCDRPAMQEPVGYDHRTSREVERSISRVLSDAAKRHPEWVKNGFVSIPDNEYKFSLRATACCRAAGVVAPSAVKQVPFFRDIGGSYHVLTPENVGSARWLGRPFGFGR
jgi:hypothetical protein